MGEEDGEEPVQSHDNVVRMTVMTLTLVRWLSLSHITTHNSSVPQLTFLYDVVLDETHFNLGDLNGLNLFGWCLGSIGCCSITETYPRQHRLRRRTITQERYLTLTLAEWTQPDTGPRTISEQLRRCWARGRSQILRVPLPAVEQKQAVQL